MLAVQAGITKAFPVHILVQPLAFTERRFVSERGMVSPRQLVGQCTGQALTASRVNSVISNCTGRAVFCRKLEPLGRLAP